MFIAFLYIFIWVFPVGACLLVAASGNYFSYTSQHWQLKNIELVGAIFIISIVSALFAACVVFKCHSNRKVEEKRGLFLAITIAQLSFLSVMAVFSGIGLFLSFGGTIFERSYGGASVIFLNNGAWSIFYSVTVYIISIRILEKTSIYMANIFSVIAFSPILLSGSRIDYISVQLAMLIYVLYIYDKNIKQCLLMTSGIAVWTMGVAHIIGVARNTVKMEVRTAVDLLKSPVSVIDYNFINLSTFGDVGSSVFQIISLLKEVPNRMVGLSDALVLYAIRMLPGPFYPNRPGNFSALLPEVIGNGATHSIAEGYLVFGVPGVILFSVIVGMLFGCSVIAGRSYRSTHSLFALIIFSFPWLLLIRGGWYQFFAYFKAAEVVLLIYIMLLAAKWGHGKLSVILKK